MNNIMFMARIGYDVKINRFLLLKIDEFFAFGMVLPKRRKT